MPFSTTDGVFVEDDSVIPHVGDVSFCEASQDAFADLSNSSDNLSSTFIDTNGWGSDGVWSTDVAGSMILHNVRWLLEWPDNSKARWLSLYVNPVQLSKLPSPDYNILISYS